MSYGFDNKLPSVTGGVRFAKVLHYLVVLIFFITFLGLSYLSLEKYLEKNTIVQTKSKVLYVLLAVLLTNNLI